MRIQLLPTWDAENLAKLSDITDKQLRHYLILSYVTIIIKEKNSIDALMGLRYPNGDPLGCSISVKTGKNGIVEDVEIMIYEDADSS